VDPRAGLDDVEKRKFLTLQGPEFRPFCRPARSQSLYRLSYPGSQLTGKRLGISSSGLMEVLFHLPGDTRKDHEKI
jgi:hypothetical protein